MAQRNGVRIRKTILMGGIIAGLAMPAAAQRFAVESRVPANPLAVLSIPDTGSMWAKFSASPLGKAAIEYYNQPQTQNTPEFQKLSLQIGKVQETSGISLWPQVLFTEELSGLDLYVVDRDGLKELVVALETKPGNPGRILDAVKKDAESATGVANSFTAQTVEEKLISGKRALSLPAFEMHLVADSDTVLLWSTDARALESALLNEGKAYPASDAFKSNFAGLGEGEGHAWMVGDYALLEPLLERPMTALPNSPLSAGTSAISAFRVQFDEQFIKATAFTPYARMDDVSRRYGMAAPAAGELSILNFFSDESLAIYATNYFDGLTLLEQGLSALGDSEGAPVTSAQVEEQLQASRQVFGFDLRNDLLANLGPNLGFALSRLEFPKGGGASVPEIDFVAVCGIKDPARFQAVLDKLEALMSGNSAKTPAPGQAPTASPLKSEQVGQLTMKYYEDPQLVAIGFRPSYVVTDDNYLILALHPEGIKEALRRYSGEDPSILDTDLHKQMETQLDSSRNSAFIAPGGPLARTLMQNLEALTKDLSPEQKLNLEGAIKLLDSIRGISKTSIYQAEGEKQEVLISM